MPLNDYFRQSGPTVAVTAAAVAPLGVQAIAAYEKGSQQYLITNSGGNVAFIGVGPTATEAQSKAAANAGVPVLNVQQIILTGPQDAWFSGTTVTGTSSIFITPGYGGQ